MPCDVISTRWRKLQRNNRFLFHFVLFVFIFSAGLTSARFGSQNSGSLGYKNTNRTVVGKEHWSLRREKIKTDCKWPQSMNSIRKNKGRENDKPRRKKSWLRTQNGWQLGTENFEIFLIVFFFLCVCVCLVVVWTAKVGWPAGSSYWASLQGLGHASSGEYFNFSVDRSVIKSVT